MFAYRYHISSIPIPIPTLRRVVLKLFVRFSWNFQTLVPNNITVTNLHYIFLCFLVIRLLKNQRHPWEKILSYSHSHNSDDLPAIHFFPLNTWLTIFFFIPYLSTNPTLFGQGLIGDGSSFPSRLPYPCFIFLLNLIISGILGCIF